MRTTLGRTGEMRMGRWLTVVAALIATAVLSASCTFSAPQVLSAPGEYGPGSHLILDGGSSLTLPAGWSASVMTTGAAIGSPPERSVDRRARQSPFGFHV